MGHDDLFLMFLLLKENFRKNIVYRLKLNKLFLNVQSTVPVHWKFLSIVGSSDGKRTIFLLDVSGSHVRFLVVQDIVKFWIQKITVLFISWISMDLIKAFEICAWMLVNTIAKFFVQNIICQHLVSRLLLCSVLMKVTYPYFCHFACHIFKLIAPLLFFLL